MKKLAVGVFTLAMAVAYAASAVKVDLITPMTVAGTELKAGEYKVTVEGNTATFKSDNKKTFTVPATVVTGGQKYSNTMMESAGTTLKSIHIGGTDTTIVFSTSAAVTGGN